MTDEIIQTTAWSLMGDYYEHWATGEYQIRLVGGRTLYSDAYNTRRDNICLYRFQEYDGGRSPLRAFPLRVVRRYVPFDAPVELVKIAP